jgi:hypothetical protein
LRDLTELSSLINEIFGTDKDYKGNDDKHGHVFFELTPKTRLRLYKMIDKDGMKNDDAGYTLSFNSDIAEVDIVHSENKEEFIKTLKVLSMEEKLGRNG